MTHTSTTHRMTPLRLQNAVVYLVFCDINASRFSARSKARRNSSAVFTAASLSGHANGMARTELFQRDCEQHSRHAEVTHAERSSRL